MGGSRLFVLALAASTIAVAVPATQTAHAAEGCLAADAAAFFEVREEGPLAGFEGWALATGLVNDRIPMTPVALAIRDGVAACDLTNGLDAFLGAKASPASPDEALATSLFVVHALWLDVFPNPVLLPALGLDAEAPVVTRVPGGYRAEFTAWTDFRGHVARFVVTLDGAVDARFTVLANAVGPFGEEEQHGWLLVPGDKETWLDPTHESAGADATKTILAANADGTQWRITYFTERYASEAVADSHANMHKDGALAAYANQTGWGFRSTDPDRILDLTLDGCDCIYAGHQANIHMFPKANDILPLLPGLAYPNGEHTTARLIVGHELFHHFQYGIQQWRMGGWMTEGQARFSETAFVPDDTHFRSTLTYWPNLNGMNGFLLNTNAQIGAHSYDWSIVWGWLYAHDGGIALLKRALEETRTGGTVPDTDGVAAINRAIAAMPSHEHADFREAYNAMAAATITHEGWTWGKPDGTSQKDWSLYFVPTARVAANALAPNSGTRSGTVRLNGFECVNMRPTAAPSVGKLTAAATLDPTTTGHLLGRTSAGWNAALLTPAASVDATTDGVACLVRTNLAPPSTPVPLPATPPSTPAALPAGSYNVAFATA